MALRIGDVLVQKGIITDELLQQALEIQSKEPQNDRRRVGEVLYEDLGVDRHKVLSTLTSLYAIKEIQVTVDEIPEEQYEFIKGFLEEMSDDNRTSMIRAKMLPLKFERSNGEGILTLIAADPTDPTLQGIVEQLNYRNYEIAYTKKESVEELISKILSGLNDFLGIIDEIDYDEEEQGEDEEVDESALDAEINQSALTALVEGVLVEAVRQDVSDIHIIPSSSTTTDFLFRLDGKLSVWHTQKGVKPEAIIAVFKDKTRNVDRFERDKAQDGFIQRSVDDYLIRYRVSLIPIVGQEFDRKFESVVIRILDDRKVVTDLSKLGLQPKASEDFYKAIAKPSGIIIVTGPTGSGKSTTLIAALYAVITPEVCVLTVEEPVEYLIKGARQLKISDKMDFDLAMRAILRHDPDIVLVGEIRDKKTAEIAIKLANTGHLTFSTLHTNDAPSAVSRLFKMGIEPFLIAYSVNIIMAQRLIRRLCNECKIPMDADQKVYAKELGFTDEELETEKNLFQAVGCSKCRNGYKGRTAIMEGLYFTSALREIIVESGTEINEKAILEQGVKDGMLTLRYSGINRIKEGITSVDEIAAITVDD